MIATPLLPLRNRLAEMVLRALADTTARQDLARLAEPGPSAGREFSWLADVGAEQIALVRERARRAHEALLHCPPLRAEPSLDETLAAAATLFDAGLHFEVHELLEPHWARGEGAERQALQGLIQIAVGYQHLANGNLEGARALLDEGPRRLLNGDLPDLDLTRFATAVAGAADRIGRAAPITVPSFPRSGGHRPKEGRKWISS
jgi:hypothetical protein